MLDIRRQANRMDISPDQAEKLFREVGEELAVQTLRRVQKKLDYQATLPFHKNKKSAGWLFGVEADICRREFRAVKKRERLAKERLESKGKARETYESGWRPTIDGLYGSLEDGLVAAEKVAEKADGEKITYEDFQMAKRFLDSLEEE